MNKEIKLLLLAIICNLNWIIPNQKGQNKANNGNQFETIIMTNKSEIGTIEIQRPKGTEIWNITTGNFSIDKPTERFRMNFWVESDEDLIHKLEDTGQTPVIFEIKVPFNQRPSFKEKWKYKHSDFKYTIEDDYGDDEKSGYWDNFYYYSHESLENIEMEIVENGEKFLIKVIGEMDDPINWENGKAKYIITANMKLKNDFKSYWME